MSGKNYRREALSWAARLRHGYPDVFFDLRDKNKISYDLWDIMKDPAFEFPVNPHHSSSQRLMMRAVHDYDDYYATIPEQCHAMWLIMQQKLTHRRKDTLRNILYVAEALCHRAAYEKDLRIFFAYDSLSLWVKLAKNHNIAPTTIKVALRCLNDTEFFNIKPGVAGDLTSCTGIHVMTECLDRSDTWETMEWSDGYGWVMQEIYEREDSVRDERVLKSSQADGLLLDTMGQFKLDFGKSLT